MPSSNLMPFTLKPACLPNSHTHTRSTEPHEERFVLSFQTGKSSELRTDATRVRKSRQSCKRVGMGRTYRTGPSSCPQLHGVLSVCLRLSPLLLATLSTCKWYVSPFFPHLFLICQDRWASLQNFKSLPVKKTNPGKWSIKFWPKLWMWQKIWSYWKMTEAEISKRCYLYLKY